MTATLDIEVTWDVEALICADCGCGSRDGDTRNVFGREFSLCSVCLRDWDTDGVPNHITAIYGG